jgi:hypothetical protein
MGLRIDPSLAKIMIRPGVCQLIYIPPTSFRFGLPSSSLLTWGIHSIANLEGSFPSLPGLA